MSALAEPLISRRKREVRAEWRVDGTHVAILAAYHSTDRRCFIASLHQEAEVDGGRLWSPFDKAANARVGVERVARYSDRAMEDFFQRALAQVREARAAGEYDGIFNAPESEAA